MIKYTNRTNQKGRIIMSIKQAAKEERQKFHEIKGFSKKAGYIWDYYRYWIIGTIAAIAFCISIGGSIYHNIKYTQIFYCAIFNNPLTDEALVSLETDFGAYYNLNPKNETMHFDSTYVISEDGDPQTNYVTIQKIGAMVASKSVDVMLGDEFTLAQYAVDGYFYDLKDLLSAETYEALSEYMVDYTYLEENITAPFVIDLSQSELVKNGTIRIENPIAGVVINSENPLVAVEFLKYIFGL